MTEAESKRERSPISRVEWDPAQVKGYKVKMVRTSELASLLPEEFAASTGDNGMDGRGLFCNGCRTSYS